MAFQPRVVLARLARMLLNDAHYVRVRDRYRALFHPERPVCPVCESAVPTFDRNAFGELLCPRCGAFPRTRAAMLYLRSRLRDGRRSRVLNFAPHPSKAERLASLDRISYVTADHPYAARLYGSHCMLRMDLERMPCNDGAFDYVVAIGVVQFVLRDDAMFAEVARVLADGGRFVFETTIFGDSTVECYSPDELATLEYGRKDALDGLLVGEKWRLEGKLLHDPRQYVRKYGLDIRARLERAGFIVNPIRFDALCAAAGRTPRECGLDKSCDHLLFECVKPHRASTADR